MESAGTPPLWVAENKATPHIYYHIKFGSSVTKGVRINRREHPELGSTRALPPWVEGVVDITYENKPPFPYALPCQIW